MTRARTWRLICVAAAAVGIGSLSTRGLHAADEEDPSVEIASDQADEAPPPAMVREIERIRRDLGGPAVDRYPRLRPAASGGKSPEPYDGEPSWSLRKIEALRRTASDLDERSNQLESLELYEQADGMRRLAQTLRLEARRLARSDTAEAARRETSDSSPPGPPLARIAESLGDRGPTIVREPAAKPGRPDAPARHAAAPGRLPD